MGSFSLGGVHARFLSQGVVVKEKSVQQLFLFAEAEYGLSGWRMYSSSAAEEIRVGVKEKLRSKSTSMVKTECECQASFLL